MCPLSDRGGRIRRIYYNWQVGIFIKFNEISSDSFTLDCFIFFRMEVFTARLQASTSYAPEDKRGLPGG